MAFATEPLAPQPYRHSGRLGPRPWVVLGGPLLLAAVMGALCGKMGASPVGPGAEYPEESFRCPPAGGEGCHG